MKGAIIPALGLLLFLTTAQALEMEWVTVGDPGNAADTRYDEPGFGGVDCVYNIGKYEVTNAQYCEFLNAVAASDPNGLYNPSMAGGEGGITRSGFSGSYTYHTIGGRAKFPANHMSWYDTLRFANWMHNGQPIGPQGPATTEDGAYDLSLGASVVRKPGALVFLPDEDEWYKAAYYDGESGEYYDYPTGTNTAPRYEYPPGTDMLDGSANYDMVVGTFTEVGAYNAKPSDSPYGTFDQGGNAWERNETDVLGDGSVRGLRGGSFGYATANDLHAAYRYIYDPADERNIIGFRVAAVPEPEPDSADLPSNGNVDLHDFATFQAAFNGPG